MRILLVNVPHPAIGSRIPKEQLPPLGLLSVGGPLIDDLHQVRLLDGELGNRPIGEMVAEAALYRPEAIMFGHSGSSSGHPIIRAVAERMKRAVPTARIVYGGVHPTYHWREILAEEPWVDAIVRGEGEEIVRQLVRAWESGGELREVRGIAFRNDDEVIGTPPAEVIRDLDAYRIGWELIDHRNYGYWGGKRAVVIQFSRGCPHLCNYCGQRGFWTRWRHRDPERLAAEIARLHRDHGVEVFNFADENPSAGRKPWKAFLEALIATGVEVTLVGSTRADDIVRDADILHLYKKAGFERFLLGMENTDEATLKLIRKGGSTTADREAIRLLRQHNILSMATWVVGFAEESLSGLFRGLRQIISYDPDQIQALYVTPHRWTPFYRLARDRRVIQRDASRWDYKHQVLATDRLRPWQLILLVKLIEACAQLRPRALRRFIWHPEPKIRHAIRWYYRMGRRVWFHELWSFFVRERRNDDGLILEQYYGAPQDQEEEASAVGPRRKAAA